MLLSSPSYFNLNLPLSMRHIRKSCKKYGIDFRFVRMSDDYINSVKTSVFFTRDTSGTGSARSDNENIIFTYDRLKLRT